jgi:hypothetical protein
MQRIDTRLHSRLDAQGTPDRARLKTPSRDAGSVAMTAN